LATDVAQTRPLSEFRASELEPLLEAEAAHWHAELLWDYAEVSAAVASGVERRSLTGRVLLVGDAPVAYCYYLEDGDRAIVGSLYASEGHRGLGLEEDLLTAVLREAQAERSHRRVECQTLFSTSSEADACFSRSGFASAARHYLVRPLGGVLPPAGAAVRLRHLRRSDLDEAGTVVYESHRGSLDAALNTTYATPRHCRHFVETLVLRAGCGQFEPEASFVAEGPSGLAGVILASHLSPGNGHVCQVSVRPQHQGQGLGWALLRATLDAFARSGLQVASLSVTVDNRRAYRLYEGLGFEVRRSFAAHAWARPPARIVLPV
jgi:ribosomal protein S18 acetylase RimI-like enzyme